MVNTLAERSSVHVVALNVELASRSLQLPPIIDNQCNEHIRPTKERKEVKVGNISNFKRTSGGVGTLRHMKLVGFVCLLREICELLSIASTLQSIAIMNDCYDIVAGAENVATLLYYSVLQCRPKDIAAHRCILYIELLTELIINTILRIPLCTCSCDHWDNVLDSWVR